MKMLYISLLKQLAQTIPKNRLPVPEWSFRSGRQEEGSTGHIKWNWSSVNARVMEQVPEEKKKTVHILT